MSATCLNKHSKETLDRIKCECGAEIQINPDYEQLGLEIDRHALSHKEEPSNPGKAEVTFERIQNNLISQIFKRTSTQK